MNKQGTIYILLVILTALIAVSYWPAPLEKNHINNAPSSADYFLKKVSVKQFDQAGNLDNQLNADKLEHFKNEQLSEIVEPQIIITNAMGKKWLVSAKAGKLNHTNNQIELENSVLIQESSNSTESNEIKRTNSTTMKTEMLLFDLANNTAHTKDKVVITTKNTITTAKVMMADFKNNLIKFEGQTSTEGTIHESE